MTDRNFMGHRYSLEIDQGGKSEVWTLHRGRFAAVHTSVPWCLVARTKPLVAGLGFRPKGKFLTAFGSGSGPFGKGGARAKIDMETLGQGSNLSRPVGVFQDPERNYVTGRK